MSNEQHNLTTHGLRLESAKTNSVGTKSTKQKGNNMSQTDTDISANRCKRCNRKLKDPFAQYGWRCAEILGIDEQLDKPDGLPYAAYMLEVYEANQFLKQNNIDTSKLDLKSFYKNYIEQSVASKKRTQKEYEDDLEVLVNSLVLTFDEKGMPIFVTEPVPANEHVRKLQKQLNNYRSSDDSKKLLEEDGIPNVNTFTELSNTVADCATDCINFIMDAITGKHQWEARQIWNEINPDRQHETEPATYALGITIAGEAGARGSVSWQLVLDKPGNWGVIRTVGVGGGFVGFSGSVTLTVTNAQDIYALEGISQETGFSTAAFGGDLITAPDYTGYNASLGVELGPVPLDLHADVTYTTILLSGDLIELKLHQVVDMIKSYYEYKASVEEELNVNYRNLW